MAGLEPGPWRVASSCCRRCDWQSCRGRMNICGSVLIRSDGYRPWYLREKNCLPSILNFSIVHLRFAGWLLWGWFKSPPHYSHVVEGSRLGSNPPTLYCINYGKMGGAQITTTEITVPVATYLQSVSHTQSLQNALMSLQHFQALSTVDTHSI